MQLFCALRCDAVGPTHTHLLQPTVTERAFFWQPAEPDLVFRIYLRIVNFEKG